MLTNGNPCGVFKKHILMQIFKFGQLFQYNIIMGMSWLNVVDTKIDWKDREVHGRLSNDKPSNDKGERAQRKVLLIFATQIRRIFINKEFIKYLLSIIVEFICILYHVA